MTKAATGFGGEQPSQTIARWRPVVCPVVAALVPLPQSKQSLRLSQMTGPAREGLIQEANRNCGFLDAVRSGPLDCWAEHLIP